MGLLFLIVILPIELKNYLKESCSLMEKAILSIPYSGLKYVNNDESARRYEKVPLNICANAKEASKDVAAEIAALIKIKQLEKKPCVLGLATGSTPVGVYEELVRLHKEEKLSFKNVVTFNLDEYYPMQPDAIQSYVRFMYEHLFDHIDIKKENVHIPDGTLKKEKIAAFCRDYEKRIVSFGGIDLQVLGIGRTGHIGFNEPGSPANSKTRLITLDHLTRADAASDFYGEENTPRQGITMGVGSILAARRVILLAWGENKVDVVRRSIEGEVSDILPATYLQNHPNATFMLDEASAAGLTRVKAPWLTGTCKWDDRLVRKAVVWLCQKVDKPILKLTDRDYNDNGMGDLVSEQGPSNKINIKVFNDLQHTITGWPGGKPNADDTYRPERKKPYPKRVLVFSPHPDDDVISMGGTIIRLAEQGHEVHVAYQTTGSIAVFDDDVVKYADFVNEYNDLFIKNKQTIDVYKKMLDFMKKKQPGQVDSKEILSVKEMIREVEARAACRFIGIEEKNIHFLEMPFYETGKVKKKPIGKKDIQIITDVLQKVKPHQVYIAGDLSDPHGTHRMCFSAVAGALQKVKDDAWMNDCYCWLYRGAWQEWDIYQIDMAVPLSPDEMMKKRSAIFKHESQKDKAKYPGVDSREFWQRSDERNKETAQTYDKLGLAEYEGIEAFVRYGV